jgi:hypothetical protein
VAAPPTVRGRLARGAAAALAGLALAVQGCAAPTGAASGPADDDAPPGAFRVRADVSAPLDADAGWAGAQDEAVTVVADRPFRIRFEAVPDAADPLRLQVRRNGGAWEPVGAHDFPYPETATPRVSVVSTTAYDDGAATADLLDGSALPFGGGAGVDLAATSGTGVPPGTHGEWEWPVVVRRYADGPVANEAGDTFAFRLVDGAGRAVSAEAAVTLDVPPGHLGGTFVETPGRLGPWQAPNGDLYVVMEPTETDNVMMVVKSEDGGAGWREADGAGRPLADDLEGVGTAMRDGTLHVLHQTSDAVWYHAFRTSEYAAAPDTWALTDELVAEPGEPPTQVAALAARPDGSLVAVYGAPDGLRLRVRSPDGAWGPETAVDPGADAVASGPQAEPGPDGVVHLASTDDAGAAWHRLVRPDGSLTPRQRLASDVGTTEYDNGAVLPIAVDPGTGAATVVYRRADGRLYARRVSADGALGEPARVSDRRVVQNAVDSDQTGADAVALDGRAHVLLVEDGTGHLYHAATDAAGAWCPETLVADDLRAQWVRGLPVGRPDGSRVYGYVVDAGSDGGAGKNRYGVVDVGNSPGCP